jgi:hypothetical protein
MAGANILKKSFLFAGFVASLSSLDACGGGGTTHTAAPTVTFTASSNSVLLGQTVTLTWSATNATSCAASADPAESDWSGSRPTNSSQSVNPATPGTITYTLTYWRSRNRVWGRVGYCVCPKNAFPGQWPGER